MASVTKNILTADQFVACIISVLALRNKKHFVLQDTELDEKFQKAFEVLMAAGESLNIIPNFSFYIDPLHGDSVSLRETLLAAKEKELIALNNPTFHTFDIKIGENRALRYLKSTPIPPEFFDSIVDECFAEQR